MPKKSFVSHLKSAHALDAAIYDNEKLPEDFFASLGEVTGIVAEGNKLQIGNFVLTPVGLLVQGDVRADEWLELGSHFRQISSAMAWLVGDWMAYGNTTWGQTYEQAAQLVGRSVKTLYNWAYVASNVEFSRRRENLTFKHHALVASLSPDQQVYFLGLAEDESLSSANLQMRIEGHNNPNLSQDPPTLPGGEQHSAIFSPQIARNFKKMFTLGIRAGQGDRRAAKKVLSQIEEHRRWLDEFERRIREGS